jgi:aspartate/methionine/tyrosine aminotransferase
MRPLIDQLPASKIREVANAAMGRDDVLAFWFGESDEPTPQFIRDAAAKSIADGETFYSHNLGLAELRDAIAGYVGSLHPVVGSDRIAVTSSGVSALMLAMQSLVGPGDEVVAVVPVWPNLTAQPAILGAHVTRFPLRPGRDGAWRLDVEALEHAVTDRTRVLLVNSPNNPTGWTLSRAEQETLLAHCRSTGTWIVADEVYERIFFGDAGEGTAGAGIARAPSDASGEAGPRAAAAPSFLDIAGADDRLIIVHSFSKSFLMTGWRLGWLVLPTGMAPALAKLIEFNTSCAPVFVQRAGLAALANADAFVPGLVERLKACRDTLLPRLLALPGVEVATPPGGLYAFFRAPGSDDSLAFAKRLVEHAGIGLAPGAAFGAEGEGWLRWCFASHDPRRLSEGADRLARFLAL